MSIHEQARAEAEKRLPDVPEAILLDWAQNQKRASHRDAFVQGAIWAATRTREWSSIDPPPGWFTFGTHVEHDGPLEFSEAVGDDLMPLWERPATHPRVVTTVSELVELPVGSVVLDHRSTFPEAWQKYSTGWWVAGEDRSLASADVLLPARVLYDPEETR